MAQQVIQEVVQPFFIAAFPTFKIENLGGSNTKELIIESTNDYLTLYLALTGYDQNGSMFEDGVRSDRFKMTVKTANSGVDWQTQAFDLKHFMRVADSTKWTGFPIAKASIIQATISHIPCGLTVTPPFEFEISLFGMKVNTKLKDV